MSWEPELQVARQAAAQAGAVIRRYFRGTAFNVASKGHDNPVTSADLEANEAIKALLTASFPDYGWLSEETADNPARLSRKRVWIVDPLDGTKEFIQGIAEFAVAIALAEDGLPVLGVTYNPIKEEMFWCARGMGCYRDGRPVHVTTTAELRHATLLASRSEVRRGEWKRFEGLTVVSPTGSVAYKLALVAAGVADATLTRKPKSEWDVASGAALIAEAGGRMTDLEGRELRFNQPQVLLSGMIASNEPLYPQLSDVVRSLSGDHAS